MDTRRATALAALLLGLASPALAQRSRDAVNRPAPEERVAEPRSPFQPAPLVGGGLPPRPGVDAFRAGPDTYRPLSPAWREGPSVSRWAEQQRQGQSPRPELRRGRNRGGAVSYPVLGGIYVPPYAYWPYDATTAAPAVTETARPEPAPPELPTGFLRLLVTPRNAAVIVDGIYEGSVDDFGGAGERALPSGVHRIRLETEGFEPVEFDVRVPDNDTITLRRDLNPKYAAPALTAPQPAPPTVRKTIYVIPRCYLGDTPPRADRLPAGCSLADLRTLP